MFAIRDMTADDVSAVVDIITAHDATDGSLAERCYREYFEGGDVVSERERNIVGIVKDTEIIAGVAGLYPDKYDWPGVLWLNWFYVDPERRGRGLGKMLLRHVIQMARALEVRKLYVDTSTDPSYGRALLLYKGMGFREEGRLLDYYEPGEDFLILGLNLSYGQGPVSS